MPTTSWIVTYRPIPWEPATGEHPHPLGRNVRHDSRNRSYPYQRTAKTLTSQLWPRHIGILDQGAVGSCTGEEEIGALATGPLWDALSATQRSLLTQAEAYKIYSEAETIDGDGPYPPNDNGSSGPSAAQAAKNDGFISGYTHCFSLADVLDALETGPVGIGANWYTSMDQPDSNGLVVITPHATVRGGHEFLCRGKDITAQLLHFDNSWGTSFGVNGSFSMSYATLERLLSEQGDATVSLPLSVAPPIPVPPTPPTPPIPPIPPSPIPPDTNPDDHRLATIATIWVNKHHISTSDRNMDTALTAWLRAKGFIS